MVYAARSLSELPDLLLAAREGRAVTHPANTESIRQPDAPSLPDFSDFRGNPELLRALMIAAAGRHSVLLFGPPGSGKTMAAMRFPSLLPRLGTAEALELSAIRSLAGLMKPGAPFSTEAPFRAPHHSATLEGMLGGGRILRPGEISLAHQGVLFLDETPEFGREVLQALREPMEDGWIGVVRAGRIMRYPADFQLILAANLCPCGNLGRRSGRASLCVCSEQDVQQYWKRLGGPLLDRIDIRIGVSPVMPEALLQKPTLVTGLNDVIMEARRIQESRNSIWGGRLNSRLPAAAIHGICRLEAEAEYAYTKAVQQRGLSARACHSILKVARTIADLDQKPRISVGNLLEAMAYRIMAEGAVSSGYPNL